MIIILKQCNIIITITTIMAFQENGDIFTKRAVTIMESVLPPKIPIEIIRHILGFTSSFINIKHRINVNDIRYTILERVMEQKRTATSYEYINTQLTTSSSPHKIIQKIIIPKLRINDPSGYYILIYYKRNINGIHYYVLGCEFFVTYGVAGNEINYLIYADTNRPYNVITPRLLWS